MRATRNWSSKHQWEIVVADMAAGAGLIALGVNTGVIEMGMDIVGTRCTTLPPES